MASRYHRKSSELNYTKSPYSTKKQDIHLSKSLHLAVNPKSRADAMKWAGFHEGYTALMVKLTKQGRKKETEIKPLDLWH